jgi:hypothetical protein
MRQLAYFHFTLQKDIFQLGAKEVYETMAQ